MAAASLLALGSCSKMGELSPEYFKSTPQPLEAVGGQVPVTINGQFPEKYMKKKAVVTVTPELRYGNGQAKRGESAAFQGEKVMGNDQSISYRLGGRYTMKAAFPYEDAMQQSDLYLTFDAKVGKKKVEIPAVKIGSGVVATSELYKQALMGEGGCIAVDSFQRVKQHKQEAEVRFLVNQATLRQSELKNNSVQEFISLLKKIKADQGQTLGMHNVEVAAYASPEGGFSFNDKLANKRQDVSEDYVKGQLKKTKVDASVSSRYTAQDWDGFQKLVQASNIQDKDVILRVLSMYKDPEERERQIRNMSEGFRELADYILPELRRSRLTINYETIGRSDEQIKEQYAADPAKLDVEEMLYLATLEETPAAKEAVYRKAAEYYDKDYRGFNNAAVMAFNRGDSETAKEWIAKALRADSKAPEAFANLGLIDLAEGNVASAENNIANAIGANGFGQALGNLNIAKGNFAQAEENFENSANNSAALAQILNKNYEKARQTLDGIKAPNGLTHYLKAILSARTDDKAAAASHLAKALEEDPNLGQYAAKDLELAGIR